MAGKKGVTAEVSKLAGEADGGRQRSKIAFPYVDLNDAVTMAQAIHEHVGNNECDDDQLAAWTDQSAKSSGFRNQFYAGRTFGILSGHGNKHSLTDLGQEIVDPTRIRIAKARAFLTVPLYKAIFEKYKSGVLPPTGALEREIVSLGVSEKQKERARQVFERSADQAGFFEHGKNRLVMPGIAAGSLYRRNADQKPPGGGGGGGSGGGGDEEFELDPLLLALLKKIPSPEKGWPAANRVRWFRTFAMNVSQIYDAEDEPVELKISSNGEPL